MDTLKEVSTNKYIRKLYSHFMHDSLRRNSTFLLLSTGTSALLGFIFWSIAAHKYSPSSIGIVTALIGATAFIIELSQIGLGNGLIRYMSSFKNKHSIINTVFTVVSILSILSSVVFLALTHYIFPKADFINESTVSIIFFVLFVLTSSYGGILDGLFVSFRATQLTFIRNISMSTIKILAILLIGGGLLGLFYSIAVSVIFGAFIGLYLLWDKFNYRPSKSLSKETFTLSQFSIINYLSSGTAALAIALVPLLIIRKIGASDAAFYYIAYSIVTLLNYIPKSISQSFFAEGSNNEKSMGTQLKKALRFSLLLSIPAALVLLIFGKYVLLVFGKQYSESALICLRLLTLTSLLSVINYFGDNILNVQKRLKLYTFTNIFGAVTTILFMYPLLRYGLTGVGLGWLFSEIATAILYLYIFRTSIFSMINFRKTRNA